MIKKIAINELTVGMEVVALSSSPWKHQPYLYAVPGVIESEDAITRIKKSGFQQVVVRTEDVEALADSTTLNTLLHHTASADSVQRAPFSEAIKTTRVTYESAMAYAMKIINDVKMGRGIDYETALETANAIVDSAISNPDTLICLSRLAAFDEYTYTHSINVAAIAVVFGEFIGMSRDDLVMLGLAGMMHDLGKTSVPTGIVHKNGRLSRFECAEMQRHPEYGYAILSRNTAIPHKVLEAVRAHHEKCNGSGYPNGLTRQDIPAFARILCMADIYDALTSDRCYKKGVLPNKALGIMYGMRDQDFDSVEVQLFIKCLGIFPAGSLVKLNTGDFALVFESNADRPLCPKIKIIMDHTMRPVTPWDLDLANQSSGKTPPVEIKECADPSKYRDTLLESMMPQ
ncbi:DUF3391 domain-containing protein [Pseudodesulfovibrio sp. JC047]|uniref:HD-GYP domain-containing protein n=1 Tax=Pseudodesulfovibrio sp. JC047 TaxID=2683199 RepID=UPI0013D89481|nr:HD-GYP domain-containing protein [Pseudodesulfovibrio sp. JC047]NDV19661.1 DUF3391 domain-containing protein [Pseudodesulfovibrio sp. JC047]